MFIVERSAAAVVAALAIAAGPAFLGSVPAAADRQEVWPAIASSDTALSRRTTAQLSDVVDGRNRNDRSCRSYPVARAGLWSGPPVGRTADGPCASRANRTGSSRS